MICHCGTVATIVVYDDEAYCRRDGRRAADKEARNFVLRRDRHRCRYCKRTDVPLEWAHVITRGAPYIRWDPENAVTLCRECHVFFTSKRDYFTAWIGELYGLDRLATLLRREAEAERRGGHVDVAQVIRDFRETDLTAGERRRYAEGMW